MDVVICNLTFSAFLLAQRFAAPRCSHLDLPQMPVRIISSQVTCLGTQWDKRCGKDLRVTETVGLRLLEVV